VPFTNLDRDSSNPDRGFPQPPSSLSLKISYSLVLTTFHSVVSVTWNQVLKFSPLEYEGVLFITLQLFVTGIITSMQQIHIRSAQRQQLFVVYGLITFTKIIPKLMSTSSSTEHNLTKIVCPGSKGIGTQSRWILLHVHPLLGKVLLKMFPRRQILGKQSVARLPNNKWDWVFYAVWAKQQWTKWLCNPFLSNGWVNIFPLKGPCYESGDVINNKDGVFHWVYAECL
jgi:hypothetical protein